MPSPIGSARSNGKVGPMNDAPDQHATAVMTDKALDNGNLTVTVGNEPVDAPIEDKEKSNFFTRLFKKKTDEKPPAKKEPDARKVKRCEIVSHQRAMR